MCNLSDVIWEDGYEKGYAEGRAEERYKRLSALVHNTGWSWEEVMQRLGYTETQKQEIYMQMAVKKYYWRDNREILVIRNQCLKEQ